MKNKYIKPLLYIMFFYVNYMIDELSNMKKAIIAFMQKENRHLDQNTFFLSVLFLCPVQNPKVNSIKL